MIEEVGDEQSASVVPDLTVVQPEDLECVGGAYGLGEELAVRLGEFKQGPIKVHTTVTDSGVCVCVCVCVCVHECRCACVCE